MKKRTYQNFFLNFASKTRFNIILCLENSGPLSVGEISEKIGEEQSNVSHHLKILATCNILHTKNNGKRRMYSINAKTVLPILNIAKTHVNNNCIYNCKERNESCIIKNICQ